MPSLSPLAPWLSTNPAELYAKAQAAGSQVGLGLAEAQSRANQAAQSLAARYAEMNIQAQEAAAKMAAEQEAQAARQWEFEQSLRQKALDQISEGERAAAALEETRRFHDLGAANEAAQLAAQTKHWTALEGKPLAPMIRTLKDGSLVQINPDGTLKQLSPPIGAGESVTPTAALNALTGMGQFTLDQTLGPGAKAALAAKTWSGLTNAIPRAVASAPLGSKMAPAEIERLRAEANAAITTGGKRAADVRALFEATTGVPL